MTKLKPARHIFLFLFIFLIASCSGGNTESPADVLEARTAPELAGAAAPETADGSSCKIPSFTGRNVALGIPNQPYRLPSLGVVKTVVLFADFEDAPAAQTLAEFLARVSPNAENFFTSMSYGKMTWQFLPHSKWLRLSQTSDYYAGLNRSSDGHIAFIQEAVSLADAEVDFSTADSVIVLVPVESAIPFGPASVGNSDANGYTADGKVFSNGVTSGADLPGWGYLWLNHESGHTLGLPDLYTYQYDADNYANTHRFAGGFGLMGLISGKAPEFFAFERWQLGWLEDSQIKCITTGEQSVTLTPIETAGGLKAVMIPVSDSKLVIVESRRALGYDSSLPKSGALVYTVDTAIATGEGPLNVLPVLDDDPYRYKSPLAKGESIEVDGVTIKVTASNDKGDTVLVTIGQ